MNCDARPRLEITGCFEDGAIAHDDVTKQVCAPHFTHLNFHMINCTAHDLWLPGWLINSEIADDQRD